MEYEVESKFKVYELRESAIGLNDTQDALANTHRYFDKKSEANEWILHKGTEGVKYAILEVSIKKRID
jgi:hypothetical protein